MARFWRRSRDWPLIGQITFALLVIIITALVASVTSNVLRRGRAEPPAAADRDITTTARTTRSSANATPTATVSVPPTTRGLNTRLRTLTIAPQTHETSYDRDANFGGWIDQHGCQDTRAVLLMRTSRIPVTFTNSSQCTVKGGRWIDPWSGVVATVAHAFQIDHTVPLQNAWVSGAWSWSQARRVEYANDLADSDQLVAIGASENESKGADGPDRWRPPRQSAWCRYALVWDRIKAKWQLSATRTEWGALVAMAATC